MYPHLRIAVMGCVVNGVGEMGDCDYGYIGCGNGMVNLYRKGECAIKSIQAANAVMELAKLIEADERVIAQPASET
jgi:(E)-4-hydroxy-3-methylbut-2-enyl-diphosphate synthase